MSATCRNCAEPVSLDFCPRCGQEVDGRRGSLFALLHEFFSEFFSLDGKHLRTALGLGRPGRLTELYLGGKRASYVRPVRVYLVSSLLFFVVIGFPAPDAGVRNVYVDGALIGRAEPDPSLADFQLSFGSTSGSSRLVDRLEGMPAQTFLDRFFAGLERTVPTALILFVPVLALAIKLLYVRRPFFYVEHLVFALHFQSFLFLALLAAYFLNRAGFDGLFSGFATYAAVLLVVAPTYLAFALRRVYRQAWGWTTAKAAALSLLYLLLLQPLLLATLFFVVRSI